MPFYENEKCPVCGEMFKEDDDIVICPYCATPHHRECYHSVGHCINQDKHADGFEYSYEKVQRDSAQQPHKDADKVSAPQSDYRGRTGFSFNPPLNEYDTSNESIDGRSVRDTAAVVRTNSLRFIPKFKKGKKVSWNWSAFFFGHYYLFFRKIYKQGFIFLALELIADFIIQGIFSQEYQKFFDLMNSLMSRVQANTVDDSMMQEMMSGYRMIFPVMAISLGVSLIFHIIIALFSDWFYREKVFSILDRVDEKLNEGGAFGQYFVIGDMQPELSQDEMKRLYLGKVGGTSFFAPLMIYFALQIISRLISQL